MYRLSFRPDARGHILVRASSVENREEYSKRFADWNELEPVFVGALHPRAVQFRNLRDTLLEGEPCELGGTGHVPNTTYHVDLTVVQKLGLAAV
jgi:hypothetical protein